jgi:hypothetical protein
MTLFIIGLSVGFFVLGVAIGVWISTDDEYYTL